MERKRGGLSFSSPQIPLPEEPDTEDEALLKKWRWKIRSIKKENSERNSQRCDTELKLAVRSIISLFLSFVCFMLSESSQWCLLDVG